MIIIFTNHRHPPHLSLFPGGGGGIHFEGVDVRQTSAVTTKDGVSEYNQTFVW